MGKKGDLSDFERGMVVGARRADLSISKTADLLGFSCTTKAKVYRDWSKKEKISSEWQLCGQKCLVDVRGQRRMGRLVEDDRRATVTQITTRYNQGMQNTISEPIEHLWDMVEREICIIYVQPTNLQQLRDAIMSIWTKISDECFQHLCESMPRRIKAVLKAKWGPTRY